MKHFIVIYKVKPGQAERNAELIRAVYAELEQAAPGVPVIRERCDEEAVLTAAREVGASPARGGAPRRVCVC